MAGGQGGGAPGQPLPAPIPLTLSAKTEPALQEAATRLISQIEETQTSTPKTSPTP